MKFNHVTPTELLELNTETLNNKRHYITPVGKFPSITSVLGSFPNEGLMKWRKRVGEEEANKVSRIASNRGTKMHSLCEKYLLNEEVNNKSTTPDAFQSFISIRPFLNKINNIHFLECPLYSQRLKVAGRSDCIAEYDEKLSLIDFKTSKREKSEEYIEDYFLQGCFYSLCYGELTGISVKNIVIIIAVDDGDSQVFIKNTKDYVKPLLEKINFYYENYH